MASVQKLIVSTVLACCAVVTINGTAFVQEKKGAQADDEKTPRNRALNLAAALGQLDKVKDLLKQGADIQWRDPGNNGKTPLVKAILGGVIRDRQIPAGNRSRHQLSRWLRSIPDHVLLH